MIDPLTKFPLYRKYSNDKSYFKVESESEFIQLQVIGKKVIESRITVVQYPERLLISDLIQAEEPHILMISETDFFDQFEKVQRM
jgi:hypothetical protein